VAQGREGRTDIIVFDDELVCVSIHGLIEDAAVSDAAKQKKMKREGLGGCILRFL